MKHISGHVVLGRLGARIVDRDPTKRRRTRQFSRLYLEGWHVTHSAGLERLMRSPDWIGGQALRVLIFCMCRMEFGNWIGLRQVDIVNELGLAQADVSRAIKKLLALGILEPGKNHGMSMGWVLHPEYGWKGDPTGKVERRADGMIGFVGGET